MKKEKPKPRLKVTYTEGWEERFAAAAYKLYIAVEKRKAEGKEEIA